MNAQPAPSPPPSPGGSSLAPPPAFSVRDRLLAAAERLVYAQGVSATGTDAILKAADAARMSLYNQFGSKEALVAAALEQRDQRWLAWFETGLAARAPAGRGRLLAMFDLLAEWFAGADFHGCAFINVCAEAPDPAHPLRRIAHRHKAALQALILAEARAAAGSAPDRLARHLFLLVEGAIVAALVDPTGPAAQDARAAAEILLEAASC